MPHLLTRRGQRANFQPRLKSWWLSCLPTICYDVPVQLLDRPYQPWTWIRWPHYHFSLYVRGISLDWHHHSVWRLSQRNAEFCRSYLVGSPMRWNKAKTNVISNNFQSGTVFYVPTSKFPRFVGGVSKWPTIKLLDLFGQGLNLLRGKSFITHSGRRCTRPTFNILPFLS